MIIIPANSTSGAFEIANSCRFDNGDTSYLSRTAGTPTNSKKFTFSAWVKKSNDKSGGHYLLDTAATSVGSENAIAFDGDQKFRVGEYTGSNVFNTRTTALFRDCASWYHCFIKGDSTQSTASDRVKIYVNGSLQNVDNEYPSENYVFKFNVSGNAINIGRGISNSGRILDGYLAEYYFIDGEALAHTEFGEFDEDSPTIWKPKKFSGSFGSNGFHLDFKDSSALGNDVSGNNNDFTSNNLAAIDQSIDTPTNNFVTWNPLDTGRTYTGTIDLTQGNLRQSNGSDASLISTIAVNSGKWYMEFKCEDADNTRTFGIIDIAESNGYVGHSSVASAISYGYKSSDGTLWIGTSSQASSVGTTSAGDIVSMAIDLDSSTKTIKWQKNGSDLSGTTQLTISHTGYYWGIICRCDGGQVISANFGSPAYSISSGNADANGYGNFEYAVPSGYYALCTKNLAEYG